jgi:hypothetical protein
LVTEVRKEAVKRPVVYWKQKARIEQPGEIIAAKLVARIRNTAGNVPSHDKRKAAQGRQDRNSH